MGYLIEVTQKHEFSCEDINDLVSTALEGGINYWCGKAEIVLNAIPKTYAGVSEADQSNVHYASDVIALGGKLKLTDVEDDSEAWELDLPKMLKGIKMHCEAKNIAPSDLMDNYDAGDADCIVQFALFNEIVFG